MSTTDLLEQRFCRLKRYERAWHAGTGVPHSLPPGIYRITGVRSSSSGLLLMLDRRYKISAEKCHICSE